MSFKVFQEAIAKQFSKMTKDDSPIFRTNVDKDKLWETYITSFPRGSNPLFRERTEHDCQACKNFIRNYGNLVCISNNVLMTLWDILIEIPAYQVVADAMTTYVCDDGNKRFPEKSQLIEGMFLTSESVAGVAKNFEQMEDGVQTWEHFHLSIPAYLRVPAREIPTLLGDYRTTYEVFYRALREFNVEDIETLLELIAQNSLYRGDEHKFVLEEFLSVKKRFDAFILDHDPNVTNPSFFVWSLVSEITTGVCRIRNTVIGSLLVDLASGVELDRAVASYEAKVAPTNYKRPTALVTPKMVENAKKNLADLGLLTALERRYATIDDLTINNVLFADRAIKNLNTDVFDDLSTEAKVSNARRSSKIDDVGIEDFIQKILPTAKKIELFVENKHTSNLMSLIAPVDPNAELLFKWPNRFSWSYVGEVADAIKERVKSAGGNVSGDLCCRLAWFNYDDLDLHMVEPNGYELYYMNKGRISPSKGCLDVDMNAGYGHTREPVENIVYPSTSGMKEGVYRLFVHNFDKRETSNRGFDVEVDFLGMVYNFHYEKSIATDRKINVMTFRFTKTASGGKLDIIESLPLGSSSKKIWGIDTQTLVPVKTVLLSPNYWDGYTVGNKHYFFMLEGCANEGGVRGFYNEFLRAELTPHRKVMEIVGGKMQLPKNPYQLSGVGFSSTQHSVILCRVTGQFTRDINIVF